MDKNLYVAVFNLARAQNIGIGRLGRVYFPQGIYLYVGSAQRNLSARIERHDRKEKPLRWHIDYLSVRAAMLGVIVIPAPRERECEVARELAELYELVVPGFGASDCRCGGHLLWAGEYL